MDDKFNKLGQFIRAVGAARLLLQRAHEDGFLIEGLVMYTSVIDAFCRIALVLQSQLETKSSDFDIKYIYQTSDRDYYSERDIYNLALDRRIVDEDLVKEIGALYDFRNKVIHRFFISEIEYSHIGIVLDRYELVYQRLYTIVYELEFQQIHEGVDMTIARKGEEQERVQVLGDILKKIDSQDLEILKKVLGAKLITDPDSFSEGIERSRIAEEIEEEKEIQKDKAAIPAGYTSVKEVTTWARRRGYFQNAHAATKRSSIWTPRQGTTRIAAKTSARVRPFPSSLRRHSFLFRSIPRIPASRRWHILRVERVYVAHL